MKFGKFSVTLAILLAATLTARSGEDQLVGEFKLEITTTREASGIEFPFVFPACEGDLEFSGARQDQGQELPAQELPAELVAQWKKAGALPVWTSANLISLYRAGKKGEVHGFQLKWMPGIAALPRPRMAFGLSFGSGG